MRYRSILIAAVVSITPAIASAQSLFIPRGDHGVEGSASWSVGPSSTGVETHAGVSLDGRIDLGIGFNRYNVDLGDTDSPFTEWTPFVTYFVFKEQDDKTPVSLAVHGQAFFDNFEGDDSGWYVLAGSSLFKRLEMTSKFALYPYLGFSLAHESYTFGGGPAETATYLTRQLGVHALATLGKGAWLRFSLDEHSFRRETYRAARAAFVKRF